MWRREGKAERERAVCSGGPTALQRLSSRHPTLSRPHLTLSLLLSLHTKNRLGGGEGIEGLYGSLTRTGMGRVLDALASHCGGLGPATHLVDVGAGLGRPLLHALALGAGAGSGVEVDAVKVEKATAFAAQTARALAGRGGEAWLERSDEEVVERGEGGGGAPPPPAS